MSELKSVYIDRTGDGVRSGNDTGKFYLKSEVDAAIEEKDRAIEFAKALTLKDIEIIKEKDKEIAKLKAKLEDAKASHYAEMVDAGMENRRLKRALWLARAKRAKERQRMLPNNKEFYTWQDIERRCFKKAEEYTCTRNLNDLNWSKNLRRKRMYTVNINKFMRMVLEELAKAEGKHPKFCDEIIPPGFDFSEDEKRWKKWNDEATTHYACDLFSEEFYEALNAYQQGDKEHALQELAQCGAVILRMMETIEKEIVDK